MSLLNNLEYSPFRTPDWRWQRARAIHEGGGLPTTRRRDSPQGYKWINKAVNFLARHDQCQSDRDKILLADRYPALFWAYHVWSSQNPQKHSIEARILARQDDYAIGHRCNLAPEVVAAYESVFFHTRDKLHHRSYIVNCVLGPALQRGISEREYDLLWKLYGYFIGPYMIDALESKFSNPIWCGTPEAVGAAVLDDAVGTLKLKAAIAAKTVQVNQYTQLALMEQFTKFVEVERNSDNSGKAEAQVLEHIAAMMTVLPFNVGGRDPRGTAIMNPRIQEFERTAIELTYEETMRLSVSQGIANENLLKNLEFPVTQATQVLEGPNS